MPYWFDGNNLIGQSAARAREDRATTRAFLLSLSSYATAGGAKFIVYFDGDDPEGRRTPNGVQVRYSAPMSTDDRILSRLREVRTPAEIIVVTNDHSLRLSCTGAGAKGIDWEEFLRRMNKGRARRRRAGEKKEGPVDIDDWARFFGLKSDSLK